MRVNSSLPTPYSLAHLLGTTVPEIEGTVGESETIPTVRKVCEPSHLTESETEEKRKILP
jgi:hypothetical protein